MTDLLPPTSGPPPAPAQVDPNAVQAARSQDIGTALKGATPPTPPVLPGERDPSSPPAFAPTPDPIQRGKALTDSGLGTPGAAAAWHAGQADDPFKMAHALSPNQAPLHQMALVGFANGLGNRLGANQTWANAAQDMNPGTAITRRADFVLSQFKSLIDQGLAGKTLAPYVDTYQALTKDAPALLSTKAGVARVQALQDFLHRMSTQTVDWVPGPEWQTSPAWPLQHVDEAPDQGLNFTWGIRDATNAERPGSPTLAGVIRQMGPMAPAVPGVEPGKGLQIQNSGQGVRMEGPPTGAVRTVVRTLYPAGDPAADDKMVPLAPVAPRAVSSFEDHLRSLYYGQGSPVTGEIYSDPSAPTHPALIPGHHILVKADLKDQGALDALSAELKGKYKVDPSAIAKINGPVSYTASEVPGPHDPEDGDGPAPPVYHSAPTPQRSLMVHLGDNPTPSAVRDAWNAVHEVSSQVGMKLDPVFYGQGDGPPGTTQIAEHLFGSKAGTMVSRSGHMDVNSPNTVPAWVPSSVQYPMDPSRLHAAVAAPSYTQMQGPHGDTTGALADNSVKVLYTHLKAAGTAPTASIAEDLTKSKVYGNRPKFLSVHLPSDPARLPAVSLGVDGVEQADAGLSAERPDAGRVVHVDLNGRTAHLDAPSELLARQTVGTLRRLGVQAPIDLHPAKAAT
jgi:hypothetical protein